jgi:hypothetical protein
MAVARTVSQRIPLEPVAQQPQKQKDALEEPSEALEEVGAQFLKSLAE